MGLFRSIERISNECFFSDANLKVHEPLRTTIYFNHPLDGNHDHHSLTEEEEREGHRELEERRKKAAYQEDNDSALQGSSFFVYSPCTYVCVLIKI